MELYSFRIIVEPEENGGYHGVAPLLRGVHVYGESLEEVKQNLKEAIKCHIQGLAKDNELIPQEEEALEMIQSFSAKELAISRA